MHARKPLRKISNARRRIALLFRPIADRLLIDRPRCERCKLRRSTDPHHVIPRSVAPQLVLEPGNLMALCRECHNWVKDNPAEAYRLGFLARSTQWDKQTLTIRK